MPRAYLDWNATAPLRPEARAALLDALAEPGNPSSPHAEGRRARSRVEGARRAVAALAGVVPDRVAFTSGATEANVWALARHPGQVLVSALEHPSCLSARPDAHPIPATPEGLIDLAALERALAAAGPGALVACMVVNNETGVIQPLADVARLAARSGARLHADATQAAGRLDLAALVADLPASTSFALSAHKLGGAPGSGALVLPAEGAEPPPLIPGGGQERRRRGGTENLPAIAAFGVACRAALGELGRMAQVAALRDGLEIRLRASVPGLALHGATVPRIANTSCLGLPDLAAQTAVIALDLAGIAVSAGSACASGRLADSHVLAAMGVPEAARRGALRVSLGPTTTPAETDRLEAALLALYDRRRGDRAAPVSPRESAEPAPCPA